MRGKFCTRLNPISRAVVDVSFTENVNRWTQTVHERNCCKWSNQHMSHNIPPSLHNFLQNTEQKKDTWTVSAAPGGEVRNKLNLNQLFLLWYLQDFVADLAHAQTATVFFNTDHSIYAFIILQNTKPREKKSINYLVCLNCWFTPKNNVSQIGNVKHKFL